MNGQPDALAPFTVHYGKWTNVTNYIACVGQDDASLEQRCGYYGEKIALWAETAGLKTGWVDTRTGSQLPDAFHVADGERFVLGLCIGTSEKVGRPHKVKSVEQLSDVTGQTPEGFARGMEAAQLAPTAGNQQAFTIHFDGTNLSITTADGNLACVDMGIAQYHFELGSGIDHARWAQA